MEHKMFKLVSGEIVIAEVENENETELNTVAPAVINMQPTPDGKIGISLYPLDPFMASTTSKYTIQKNHIMMFTETDPEIIKSYVGMTSRVVVPQGAGGDPKIVVP